jgi:hypothetical protein
MPITAKNLHKSTVVPWVFNEDGVDNDFRVESDGNTHALFVDGGNNRVGILNSAPTVALDVTGAVKASTTVTAGTGVVATTGGVTAVAGGVTATAGGLTATAGGLLVTAGRIREVLTPTDVDAQHNTLTVAQIVAGIVVHTSVTGGGTVTTDTAANIIAGATGVGALTADGQCIQCYYINDGTQTLTLAGGDSVTIADTGQTIAANTSALLLIRRASATTVVVYHLGG